MDAEMRDFAANVLGTLRELKDDINKSTMLGAEAIRRVTRIEAHIFGSKPPPPDAPPGALVVRVSAAENEVDELKGQVLACRAVLDQQSRAMGLPEPGKQTPIVERAATFFFSREGRNFTLRLATLAVAALTLIATMRAAANNQPPPRLPAGLIEGSP